VPARPFTDAELEAALAALTKPDRFRAAERRVASVAPELQRILIEALNQGGWFDAHDAQVREVASTPDEYDRARAVQRLLAEENRLAMLVGVAVGWELARELEGTSGPDEGEGD